MKVIPVGSPKPKNPRFKELPTGSVFRFLADQSHSCYRTELVYMKTAGGGMVRLSNGDYLNVVNPELFVDPLNGAFVEE